MHDNINDWFERLELNAIELNARREEVLTYISLASPQMQKSVYEALDNTIRGKIVEADEEETKRFQRQWLGIEPVRQSINADNLSDAPLTL